MTSRSRAKQRSSASAVRRWLRTGSTRTATSRSASTIGAPVLHGARIACVRCVLIAARAPATHADRTRARAGSRRTRRGRARSRRRVRTSLSRAAHHAARSFARSIRTDTVSASGTRPCASTVRTRAAHSAGVTSPSSSSATRTGLRTSNAAFAAATNRHARSSSCASAIATAIACDAGTGAVATAPPSNGTRCAGSKPRAIAAESASGTGVRMSTAAAGLCERSAGKRCTSTSSQRTTAYPAARSRCTRSAMPRRVGPCAGSTPPTACSAARDTTSAGVTATSIGSVSRARSRARVRASARKSGSVA